MHWPNEAESALRAAVGPEVTSAPAHIEGAPAESIEGNAAWRQDAAEGEAEAFGDAPGDQDGPNPVVDPFHPVGYEQTDRAHAGVIVPAPLPRRRVPASMRLAKVGEELLAWFKTLVSAAVYATLIVTFGFQVARVEGQSMAPTLEDQDRLIVNKLEYRLPNHSPRVGDIVMLLYPNDPEKSFVKRVVAEPGDTIRSIDGKVYRNDVPLPDDFIPQEYLDHNDTWGPEVVREGYYFVMGDHRNNSSDSRTWGFVPKKYIIGRVQLRWWPISKARIFSDWPERIAD